MIETLSGEVTQLLNPDEAVEQYLVPSEMALFAKEGYHIAVIRTESKPNIIRRAYRYYINQEHPWVTYLAILNPEFKEGDTVEIEAREINRANFYVSPNPFAEISQQAGDEQ